MLLDLRDLYKKEDILDKSVTLQGWIRNHRKQKEFGFIDLYDGTCFESLQVVYDNKLANFDEITKIHIGSAVKITGEIIVDYDPREKSLDKVWYFSENIKYVI